MTTDVAYAAGILDGEGSFATYIGGGPCRNSLNFAVSVWQSDYDLLLWLKSKFQGGVYGRNGAGYGANSRKVTGEWRVTSTKAAEFLVLTQPHLIVRKVDAEIMLKVWRARLVRSELLEALELWQQRKLERKVNAS